MNASFYNGISGIKSQQFGLDVWANNISNIGTNGFISKTPEFSTIFSTALTDSYFDPSSNDIGAGSQASATSLNTHEQGVFQPSDRVFDLALDGEGWFGLQAPANQTYYTRNGAFNIDANGYLVDDGGNYLLGTSGNNITPTTLSQERLESFGKYYNGDTQELGTAYAIADIEDVALSSVNTQTTINLPDILYYPPEATTYINYQANLDPKIIIGQTNVDINELDIFDTFDSINNTISVKGTVSNTSELQNPIENDIVLITITDIDGNTIQTQSSLDENLTWTITDEDVSSLDTTNLLVTAILQTTQETPNTEHFTTEVISPTGDKNFLDMTFTKIVPQGLGETQWDANLKLLNFYEDYHIETYDSSINYDTDIYDVNEEKGQVIKIYDPTLYQIDTTTDKVYQIIDEQIGSATFSGNGELIESDIPTLSNNGTSLSINIGEPYEEMLLSEPTISIENDKITFSGTATDLDAGENISIAYTNPDGLETIATAKIKEDGSWSTTQEYTFLNSPTDIKTFNIVNSGFSGIISQIDLDKQRTTQKDGKLEGILKDYGMDGNGNVIAEFSNGESSAIAKVAVYHFNNDQGLSTVTSTLFSATANSGDALFYTDENGNPFLGATIRPNNLETSNVSFNTALTELIIMQKAFDASSKSITTSDQMIQNAINMKR